MHEYVALCRNYFYSDEERYVAVFASARSKKQFIAYVIQLGFEPFKIIKLRSKKELRLFTTYSPNNELNPIK